MAWSNFLTTVAGQEASTAPAENTPSRSPEAGQLPQTNSIRTLAAAQDNRSCSGGAVFLRPPQHDAAVGDERRRSMIRRVRAAAVARCTGAAQSARISAIGYMTCSPDGHGEFIISNR